MTFIKRTLLLSLVFLSINVSAQNVDSLLKVIATKLDLNDDALPADLYLHIDKNVYIAGENIWFAAYILNSPNIKEYHTLHFLLINKGTKKVSAVKNFVLENGVGTGCFRIPDSLASGDYNLAAYTNKSDMRRAPIFRQQITVLGSQKSKVDLSFSAVLQPDSITFIGRIKTDESLPPSSKISYTIYADGISYSSYQQKTDPSKEIRFSLPATYYTKQLDISGEIFKGSEKMGFKQGINWDSPLLKIKFYPEGGKLIDGHSSKVGFSVENTAGKAVSANCSLLADGKFISSFNSDLYGRGSFQITPNKAANYSIRIDNEKTLPIQQFPVVQENGWSVHIANGIVSDTLRLQINNTSAQRQGVIFIHNNRRMVYGAMIVIPKITGLLKIPVTDWEPGIATVCMFTQKGDLLSERTILVKNLRPISAILKSDSDSYKPLSKANIKVQLHDSNGKPIKGIFSFSCVLEQTVTSEYGNIERFNLYDRLLDTPVSLPPWSYLSQDKNIDGVLLRQTRNSPDIKFLKRQSIIEAYDGQVLYNGKKANKPIELMIAGSGFQMFKSTNEGRFLIPFESLRGEPGQRALLTVVAKAPSSYKLVLESPYRKQDDVLASEFIRSDPFTNDDLSASEKQLLRNSGVIALKEVVIKADHTGPKGFYGKINDSGNCNDYVCYLGFLNCSSHPNGTPGTKIAVDGETYLIDGTISTEKIVYHCQYKSAPPYIQTIPVTENPSQFFPFSPADTNPPDILNRTTLHWQAFVETDERGEANINFYTNQLKGLFKTNIQGVSEEGVFSSENSFSVK